MGEMRNAYNVFVGKPEGLWIGFIWLGIGNPGGLL
jgi:hypothetical protein